MHESVKDERTISWSDQILGTPSSPRIPFLLLVYKGKGYHYTGKDIPKVAHSNVTIVEWVEENTRPNRYGPWEGPSPVVIPSEKYAVYNLRTYPGVRDISGWHDGTEEGFFTALQDLGFPTTGVRDWEGVFGVSYEPARSLIVSMFPNRGKHQLADNLSAIRQKAIDGGMKLLNEDEVLAEVAKRRGGANDD